MAMYLVLNAPLEAESHSMTDQAPRYDLTFEVEGSGEAAALTQLIAVAYMVEPKAITVDRDPNDEDNRSINEAFFFLIHDLDESTARAIADYVSRDHLMDHNAKLLKREEAQVFPPKHLRAA